MPDSFEERPGKLVLADGTMFEGLLFGPANGVATGEVVFNTAMTGYQEVITDPSYAGQMIVFTYPQIGNYGVSPGDNEAAGAACRALIVRELAPFFAPGPGRYSLRTFLESQGLPCLSGVDTRALTRRIRSAGSVIGVLGDGTFTHGELLGLAKELRYSKGESLVESVTGAGSGGIPRVAGSAGEFSRARRRGFLTATALEPAPRARAAVIDLGIKASIVNQLITLGVEPVIYDMNFDVEDVLLRGFDFVLLSNGPGDPTDVPSVIRKVENLLGEIPILGVCLGHQIAALALGGDTFKMKFGHRGTNQPVVCRRTGRVFITSQNHGYAMADGLARAAGAEITFINANDGTVEGFAVSRLSLECVQFHPEASPGPRDTAFVFEEFFQKVKRRRDATVV